MSFYIYNKVYSGVYHLLSVPPTAESDWSDQLRFCSLARAPVTQAVVAGSFQSGL